MRMFFHACIGIALYSITAFSLAAGPGNQPEAGMARREYRRGDLPKVISVVKTATPPVIDGNLDEGEWKDAAVITGLTRIDAVRQSGVSGLREMARLQSSFYVTYDDENLYIALHSPPPPHIEGVTDLINVMLKRDQTQHDANIERDDSIHISIIDPAYPGGDKYVIQINSIGTTFECVWYGSWVWEEELLEQNLGNMPGITLGWDPPIINVSSLTEKGWILEAAIPWEGLGPHIQRPEPGDIMHMNFARIWQRIMQESYAWKAHGDLSPAGKVRFLGDEGVVVQLHDTGNLPMQAGFVADIINHTGTARNIGVEVFTDSGELDDILEVNLSPGEKYQYDFSGAITDSGTSVAGFRVTDMSSGEVVHETVLPVIHIPIEEAVSLNFRHYPGPGIARIEGDIMAFNIPAGRMVIAADFTQEGKHIMDHAFVPSSVLFKHDFDVSDLPYGDYDIEISVIHGDEVLITTEKPFSKKPMPDWHGNNLGISDIVPDPWVPVKIDEERGSITCWGRDYHYGYGLLPRQITSSGQELLARPAGLIIKKGRKALDLNTLTSQRVFYDNNDARVNWRSSVTFEGVRITVDSFLEFDGMVWKEVNLTPLDGEAAIDSLKMVFPLRHETATLINPLDYSLRQTGYFPLEGWRGTNRHVWFGNEDVGVQFFGERGYNADAFFSGEEVFFEVNLIDTPVLLKSPRTFALGLQATPVKRLHPEHRRWRIGHPAGVLNLTPEKDIEVIAAWSTGWGEYSKASGEVFYPIPAERLNMDSFQGELNGVKWYRFPYYQLHETWTESPEFNQFGDQWLMDMRALPLEGRDQIRVCQSDTAHQDFVLYGFDLLQKQANPRGYYFDVSQPGQCNNIHHGCGYIDEKTGQEMATYNVLGAREMVKRIYIHMKEHRPDGMLLYHNSGHLIMPVHGFADLLLDGENTYSLVDRRDNRGYENFLTLDTYRAEYMGHNFGSIVGLLPQFTRAGSIRADEAEELGPGHAEYLLGLTLLHDSQLWIAYFYDNQPLKDMYSALGEYGFASGDYRFIPYWNQQVTQTMGEDEAVASFYVDSGSGRALMVLMNMSGGIKDFVFSLNVEELGFEPSQVKNATHSESVFLRDGKMVVGDIPSHAYRMLVLE